MLEKLYNLRKEFLENLENIQTELEAENFKKDYLGKSGKLSEILKGLKDLSNEEKKEVGPTANELKNFIIEQIDKRIVFLEDKRFEKIEQEEKIDVTAEFKAENTGHKHPLSITTELLEEIFISLGFKVEDGPQVENETLNFDMLNIPANHPARDVWDTFWITDDINNFKEAGEKLLLRTHTSPVQIREMLKGEKNIKIIVPGRVFRYEQEDARHTCNFYQLEGLVIGKGINFGDLKGTLNTVMKKLLGEKTELRFRPSIFPFTEPSAEVDVSCQICSGTGEKGGKKCSMCSGSGWVELLGAGMVHPKVLLGVGIDPETYSGFAFGMGIDRIAAQRFGVNSSRMFYQGKLKLNEQF
ncbi:phenylalanine--tRNA ligase subunit alpha [Candidatus Gracilibacteria bacterium HOT-871]|nr:phenylalanine--tRNA ligase subunit alpha [Candidatus Gracilibacteria bacterium HOT-871]RKW20615.1 MAG: phenylalanine--tRNA ligase subunit alpha [Candidatus Gracilibacteria bacterium]